MKKSQITRLFLSFLILLTLSSVALAADEWINVRSKNFFLIGNAKEKEIRNVATKLEQFREVLRQVLPKLNMNSAIPTTVLVFKSDKTYDPYRPVGGDGKPDRGIAGYFQPGQDINYITLTLEKESAETYSTIFHEYMHFLVDNNLGRGKVPSWLNEGLAEYYATFRMEKDQMAVLGDIQHGHLMLFQQQKLMPLDALFNMDYRAMHQTGGKGRSIYYAQSWALLHYLMQGNKNRTGQINQFITLLLNGRQLKEAFETAFQTDYATLEKELQSYVVQRKFIATTVTFNEKLVFETGMQTIPLSEAESFAYLGDLLLHSRRYTEAATHLEKAVSLDANLALANAALGRVRMEQNRAADAKQLLEKAIALDDKNYLINYYYAETLFSEDVRPGTMTTGIRTENAAKIRAALKRTIELKPDFAEAYRILAFVNLVNGEQLDEAVGYLQKAMTILPGNENFAFILGQIHLRKEEYDKAQRIFESLAANSSNSYISGSSRNFLNAVMSMEEQKKRFAEYQKQAQENDGRTDMIEAEENLSPAEAKNKALNGMLRKKQAGEQRTIGYLSKITCTDGIIFSIRTGEKVLKLTKTAFDTIDLITFSEESSDLSVGCDTIKKDYYVVVTYKPEAKPKAKIDGEVIALEFMPADFKLEQ